MGKKKKPEPQKVIRRSRAWVVGVIGLAAATVLLGAWLFLSRASDPPPGDVNARQTHELLQRHRDDPDFIVLDVRTPQEYTQGHLEGSTLLNLDFYSEGFRGELAKLDRAKTYLVYCRSGNRSDKTTALMKELGFRRLYNLEGGIVAWQSAGLPLKIER